MKQLVFQFVIALSITWAGMLLVDSIGITVAQATASIAGR